MSWLLAVLGSTWLFGAAAAPMALTYVLIYGLVSLGTLALVVRLGDDRAPEEVPSIGARDLLAYGLPSALATLPAMANHRLDQVLMAALIPAGQLGLYAVAASWGALVQPVLAAIASVALPRIAAQEKPSHETLGRISRSAIIVALAMEAASLLYKVVDARNGRSSTALVTNIDFQDWTDYLGDPPLVMAILDRVVDNTIIQKFSGKSYRKHRAEQKAREKAARPEKTRQGTR